MIRTLIITLIWVLIFQINGSSQILIGGEGGNIIYSSVVNIVEYIGDDDCQGLSIKLEGYDKKINFENCAFEITYLKFDTSRLEIVNKLDSIVFDTILIKNINSAKGYLQVGSKLLMQGSIEKKELKWLEKIEVKYECPWIKAPEIYGFNLIVLKEEGEYLSYAIKGSEIPNNCRKEISSMNNPQRIYIEQINWMPISCFEKMNSIVLDIK